jgi:hypothetical protein
MTREQAGQAWEELLTWRREVLAVSHPEAYRQMAVSCWYRHADVKEELGALYLAWAWCYLDKASGPLRVMEWLDRWLPGTTRRVVELLDGCKKANRHKEKPELGPDQLDDDQELSAWIEADLLTRPLAPEPPAEDEG